MPEEKDWRPYRPSSGDEGDGFMAQWCDRCIKDRAARQGDYANGCQILARSLAFGLKDPEYPTEWREPVWHGRPGYAPWKPECTAFVPDSDPDSDDPPPAPPDPEQIILIADPTEDIANIHPAPSPVLASVLGEAHQK